MGKIKISKFAKDIVSYIEENAGYELDDKTRTTLGQEMEVARQLNGAISQNYIDNLIKAYKYAGLQKKEAMSPPENTAAVDML